MSTIPRIVVLLIAGAMMFAAGCTEPCPKTMIPLDQLVGEYNANAAMVPRLWTRAKVKITVPGKLGIPFSWGSTNFLSEPNALLLLFKGEEKTGPRNFVLIGKESGMEMFRIGCSTADQSYYFWHRFGDDRGLLWGRNKYAGAPGIKGLPIDPLQIPAVLNICELPDDFTQAPTVTLSMNTTPGQCAYVVTYIDRQPITNNLLFRREVHFRWHDKKKRRPFLVNFFDARGVRIMHAELKNYEKIELVDADDDAIPPVMPTDIKITWPSKGTSVHIVLSEMQVNERKGLPEVCDLWDNIPDNITKRIQVDRNVERGAKRN